MTRLNLESIVRPFQLTPTIPRPVARAASDDLGALDAIDFSCGVAPDLSDPASGVIVREHTDLLEGGFTTIIYPATIPSGNFLDEMDEEEGEEEEADDPELPDIHIREVARETRTVRVSNPQDAEQYIDVEDAVRSTVKAPNGQRYIYHWLQRAAT